MEKETALLDFEKMEALLTVQMPYGKYKGRLLADLPGPYLGWFARQGFPAGELGALLALMYEIDHNGLADLLAPLRLKHGALEQAQKKGAPTKRT